MKSPLTVSTVSFVSALIAFVVTTSFAQNQMPEAIAASGQVLVATMHAEGAQIYECKADAAGKTVWQFREPVASLFVDGKTVGRHYAGPVWELADGSKLVGKVAGRAPGVTAHDIPLLKLDATSQGGAGMLAGITTIQRLKTKGGTAEGSCPTAGAFLRVPYAAEYAFLRK
jgi:hypothetical protein